MTAYANTLDPFTGKPIKIALGVKPKAVTAAATTVDFDVLQKLAKENELLRRQAAALGFVQRIQGKKQESSLFEKVRFPLPSEKQRVAEKLSKALQIARKGR